MWTVYSFSSSSKYLCFLYSDGFVYLLFMTLVSCLTSRKWHCLSRYQFLFCPFLTSLSPVNKFPLSPMLFNCNISLSCTRIPYSRSWVAEDGKSGLAVVDWDETWSEGCSYKKNQSHCSRIQNFEAIWCHP